MQRFCWLNREIEQNCRTSLRDAIIEEAMTIYDLLVYDEEASLRFTDPPPFICKYQLYKGFSLVHWLKG